MVRIRQIEPSRSNLKRFTDFQIRLYAGNPYYVPPLVMDDIDTLDPRKNPAFDFCESAYFMAFDERGNAVGRIAAIENRQVNEKEDQKSARFGFFDFIDDYEVSEGLLRAVEQWGKSRGLTHIVGPLGFTDLDREGMLVEGFEELSTMATNYNYPYYPRHMERHGYRKESDWVELVMTVPDRVPEKYERISEIVKRKYGLRVLKYRSRKALKSAYGQALFELINESYDALYGYSRLTERQIEHYIDMYLNLLDLKLLSLVVDSAGDLVAVGISMPSMSRALQRSRGRIFPFGWYHLLKGLKGKNDRVDLMLVAVKPSYQNKGVNALLFTDLLPEYIRRGYKYAESNPEMETNTNVQKQWEYFDRRQHRRRRAYSKQV